MPRVRSDLTRSVFSTILRIYRIGNLHGVTICRELRHSDQINKLEHGETDRPPAPPVSQAFVKKRCATAFSRDHPRPVQHGGGQFLEHVGRARRDDRSATRSPLVPKVLEAAWRELETRARSSLNNPGHSGARLHQVAGYDAGGSAPRRSSPAHPGSFTPSNRPHRLSWLRVFRLAPDDPPPRTPPCHHLPRIKTFRSNK